MIQIKGPEVEILAEQSTTFVLDVRSQREFEAIALKNANLIPVDQLSLRKDELPKDKNTTILVYCAHGVRSMTAAKILESLGYTKVKNLTGGLSAHYGLP
jgi:rhodanese-related sulfurtransferase